MVSRSPESNVAVVGSIHGNEPLGATVVNTMAGDRFAEVGHPEALAAGVRFLEAPEHGGRELGGHMPGNIMSADRDSRAAAVLDAKLQNLNAYNIVDIHSNNGATRGSEFAGTGMRTQRSLLGLASLFGLTNVTVDRAYPFYRRYPNLIAIEKIVASPEDMPGVATAVLHAIRRARELGPQELSNLYQPDEFAFYKRVADIMLVTHNGEPNKPVLKHLETLEQLPVSDERFSPLVLPDEVAADLGLAGLKLAVASWGHRNGSKPLPAAQYGTTASGTPRRQILGGCYVRIDPPEQVADNSDDLVFT